MTSIDQNGYVTFRFYRPGVSDVKVLGTFNSWNGDALKMSGTVDGWWTVCAELPEGEYRFRYLADGEWFSDYAAHGVEWNQYGWNSVLVVPEFADTLRIERTYMSEAA